MSRKKLVTGELFLIKKIKIGKKQKLNQGRLFFQTRLSKSAKLRLNKEILIECKVIFPVKFELVIHGNTPKRLCGAIMAILKVPWAADLLYNIFTEP